MQPPSKPGQSQTVNYNGATILSGDATLANTTYESSTAAQNALLVSSGSVVIDRPTVTKTGSTTDENSDFYGTNAAVLVYNGATLTLNGGTVTTDGGHANAVFAYDSGSISLTGTSITTTGNNSGGIMVTGGGTLQANNLTVKTSGNSSAAIRSDRGGGTMKVTGGTYETSGQGSPTIYSTADITVSSATLVSNSSEGVVVEGANSVTLEDVKLVDSNVTLNGNSETYKNIFIYQSMSGDASAGTGTFTAKSSDITTHQGDTFFITNTTATVNLTDNVISNTTSNGVFLRAQAGKWGNSGQNGGQVTLNATSQEINGDIILDNLSSLILNLTSASYYKGAINHTNAAQSATVTLDSTSIIVLTDDTYLTSLENTSSDNQNIYANGHKLFVAGMEVSINQTQAPTSSASSSALISRNCDDISTNCLTVASPISTGLPVWAWVTIGVSAALVFGLLGFFIYRRIAASKRRQRSQAQPLNTHASPTTTTTDITTPPSDTSSHSGNWS